MTLPPRPSIDAVLAHALGAHRLELAHWRDDDLWEVHLLDESSTIWFGYGPDLDSALAQALDHTGGSASRKLYVPTPSPLAHTPATADRNIDLLLASLVRPPPPAFTLKRRPL
jgi:hypothetical protein